MNLRLPGLIMIAAACATVIGSKLELDRTGKQADAILQQCLNRPKPVFQEVHDENTESVPVPSDMPVVSVEAKVIDDTSATEESIADLAAKDPASAAKKAEALASGYARTTALNQVAGAWAAQDPATALAWARQLADPEDRTAATAAALFKWDENDPQGAIAYAGSCDLGNQSRSTIGVMVQKWAATDMSSAISYVSQQPSGEMKDEMLSRIAPVIAANYPDLAGQMIVQRMAPGPAQTEAAISVLHQWALKDPDAATAWARAFPDGNLKERALKEITGLAEYQPQ